MAYLPTTKIVVKNLPESWTFDFLLNYLEVTTDERLLVASEAIQVFPRVTHSALITLEKPVTAETVRQSEALLARTPFQKTHVLALQTIPSGTCSLLVHCSDSGMSQDHVFYYFDTPELSGCGEGCVEDCQVYKEQMLAVVRFSSAEALEGVIAKGNHRLKNEGEALKVERWYEHFHRPLLEQLPACRRSPACNAPPPAYSAPQPAVSAAAAPNPISRAEAQEMDKLRQENERLKQKLASKEAREREEERLRQQKLREEEQRRKEQLWAERKAETHRKFMAEQRAEESRIEKERLQKTEARLQLKELKSENEKLKNQKPTSLIVPAYKFRLLENFSEQCTACNLKYLDQKEELMFYGTEEDCEREKLRVLKGLQGLSDDVIPLPEPVAQILGTQRGRSYLNDLVQRHWGCSAEIQGSSVLCAALSVEELQGFAKSVKDSVLRKTCQVPVSLTDTLEFLALKAKLEKEYMVMLTCPGGDSEDVLLDGLKGDVELAARDVVKFTNLNRTGSKKFVVSGTVQGNACRNWFSAELNEVKQLILRNKGEIEAETEQGEYILTFQCRQEVLADVIAKLEAISACIVSDTIDLNKEFSESYERALLINGLYDMSVRFFCFHLAEKVREAGVQSVGDIVLPPKCPLPPFSLDRASDRRGNDDQSQEQSQKRDHRQKRSHRGRKRGRGAHSGYSDLIRHVMGLSDQPQSHSVSVGRTTISVKLGDITTEQVAAAVSVLGPDLNPKATAIGAAFLSKWPSLSQALVSDSGDSDDDGDGGGGGGGRRRCRVLTTPTAQSGLPMSTLFHAVLSKPQKPADVSKTVREVVLRILQMAAQQGLTSIAFPPLGMGRRFGFEGYATATAMMSTIQEFLQANPRPVTNITIVLFNDVKLAGKFRKVMKQTFSGKRPRGTYGSQETAEVTSDTDSDSSDNTDSDTSQDEDAGERRTATDKFEAVVCAMREEDCQTVREMLLKELSTTFLWHETLRDNHVRAFLALPPPERQELVDSALERNVSLSLRWNGKGVKLCGQKAKVQEVLLLIQAKTQTGGAGPSQKERGKRRKLRLPEDTDRLPRYWRVCQGNQNVTFDKAIECWRKRGLRFNSVSEREADAVRQLVASTWELAKVGHGADAKNLNHSNIQVQKVERLENPQLWWKYSQRREQLFTSLMINHKGSGPATCSAVESLPNSSGAVRTSQSIPDRGPLIRDIFPQVNEHYLFHGTKTDMLSKICSEGLDERMTGKAMLGRGVYLTESPTKADQYADPKAARVAQGQELKILMVRVLLGEPYLHNGNPEMFVRPPCFLCKKRAHECPCQEPRCHDSVVFDASKIFREFVVYDRDVCYPEYIITYVRV